jgi:hypothetical protein
MKSFLRYLLLITLVLVTISAIAAPPPPPGAPAPGKVWVWIEAGYEPAPPPPPGPPGSFHWQAPTFDPERNHVIRGEWVPGAPPPLNSLPPAPRKAPRGKVWAWAEARWDLVPAPPPGPYKWSPAHWSNSNRKWITGSWVKISRKRGHVWVAPYWDVNARIWVDGFWKPAGPPLPPPPPGPLPPPHPRTRPEPPPPGPVPPALPPR